MYFYYNRTNGNYILFLSVEYAKTYILNEYLSDNVISKEEFFNTPISVTAEIHPRSRTADIKIYGKSKSRAVSVTTVTLISTMIHKPVELFT